MKALLFALFFASAAALANTGYVDIPVNGGGGGGSGPTGVSGRTGATGATGASGAGSTGVTGASGKTGATGASGVTGATGQTGVSGSPGVSGATGASGSNGSAGAAGATGSTGSSGATGQTGPSCFGGTCSGDTIFSGNDYFTQAVTGPNLTAKGIKSPTTGSTFVNSDIPGSITGTFSTVIGSSTTGLTSGGLNVLIGQGAGADLTTGASNVCIGVNSTAAAGTASATIIGTSAQARGNADVAIGSSASMGTGIAATVVGTQAGSLSTTGDSNNCFGYQSCLSLTSGAANIILGRNADTPATQSNTFVAGSSSYPIADAYFGKGITNSSAAAWTLHGVGGSGSNNSAAALILAGGQGTGTGAGGSVILQTAPAGSTGSSANALVTAVTVDTNGVIIAAKGQALLATKVTPATGDTVTITGNQGPEIIAPSGTLATLTVQLPTTPTDGYVVRLAFEKIITALTVSAGGGDSIANNATTAGIGTGQAYLYNAGDTTWYRLY